MPRTPRTAEGGVRGPRGPLRAAPRPGGQADPDDHRHGAGEAGRRGDPGRTRRRRRAGSSGRSARRRTGWSKRCAWRESPRSRRRTATWRSGGFRFWNERFTVAPADPLDAHRPLPQDIDLEALFAETDTRVVARDFTVRFENRFWQVTARDAEAAGVAPAREPTVRGVSKQPAVAEHEGPVRRASKAGLEGDPSEQAAACSFTSDAHGFRVLSGAGHGCGITPKPAPAYRRRPSPVSQVLARQGVVLLEGIDPWRQILLGYQAPERGNAVITLFSRTKRRKHRIRRCRLRHDDARRPEGDSRCRRHAVGPPRS